jgi:hypothetical protein
LLPALPFPVKCVNTTWGMAKQPTPLPDGTPDHYGSIQVGNIIPILKPIQFLWTGRSLAFFQMYSMHGDKKSDFGNTKMKWYSE